MGGNLLELRTELLAKVGPDAVKLDLGCGQRAEDGFIGLDLFAKAPGVRNVDLYKYPWPIADDSVDYFRASHFLEHVPDWDAHFTEVYRCLKMGGHYEIVAPYYKNDRWFQDPDHKQAILPQRFLYLSRTWMLENKIEHGRAAVNLEVVGNGFFELLHDDFRDQGFSQDYLNWQKIHSWNVIDDLACVLVKKPMEQKENG